MEFLEQPTVYPEVNDVLREVLTSIRSILGERLVGMYLYGSLTTGDFDRESDVDYVVLTDAEIEDETFRALDRMHQRIATMDVWCATQLEGSYLPLSAIHEFDALRGLYNHIDRGQGERLQRMHLDDPLLSRAWWGGWVILRQTLREHGIALVGPAPVTIIDPVSPSELREAVVPLLKGWTQKILDDRSQIENRGYQAYTVLTVCRILYTLENGSLVSKPVAAKWAQKTLDPSWQTLVERARIGRHYPKLQTQPDDMAATLAFIRFALEQIEHFEFEGRSR